MKIASVGDIICYHNTEYNELYFHKIVGFIRNEYRVICLNGEYQKIECGFNFMQPHTLINSKLVRLILC